MKSIKAVLFDKDGTLLDFVSTFGPASRKTMLDLADGDHAIAGKMAALTGFDFENCRFDHDSIIVSGTALDMARLWQPLMVGEFPDDLPAHIDRLFESYCRGTLTGFDGLETVLNELVDRGLKLGIATNDSEENARLQMTELGVIDRFEFIAGYDSGFGVKPEPGMVHGFADKLGLASEEIVVVGDSAHDLNCGINAGAMAIGVTSGVARQGDLEKISPHIIPGIAELPEYMRRF